MVLSCCTNDSFVDSIEVKFKSPFKEPESFPRKAPEKKVSLVILGDPEKS